MPFLVNLLPKLLMFIEGSVVLSNFLMLHFPNLFNKGNLLDSSIVSSSDIEPDVVATKEVVSPSLPIEPPTKGFTEVEKFYILSAHKSFDGTQVELVKVLNSQLNRNFSVRTYARI